MAAAAARSGARNSATARLCGTAEVAKVTQIDPIASFSDKTGMEIGPVLRSMPPCRKVGCGQFTGSAMSWETVSVDSRER
jgi:hypothetical protein